MIRLTAVLAALVPLWAAAASDWSPTFVPDRLATHLPEGDRLSVMVVPGSPESVEAAQALQAALRGTGRVELVMDDAPLGGASRLDDAAIVQRASNQPVDAVVVVRVFRSGAEPPTAVVAAYNRRGGATFGFSARAATPMEAAAAQRTAGQRASDRVAAIAHAAGDAYDQKMVGIQEFYSQGFFGLGRSVGYAQPYQGKYKHEIDWEDFYEITGHQDLAARLAGGRILKNVLGLVALVGLPGSLVVLLFVNPTLAIVLGAGAVVCYAVSYFLDPQPASLEQRKQIAEDYNASLRGGRTGLDRPGAGALLSLGPGERGLVLHASF